MGRPSEKIHKYRWLGSQVPHLDRPSITACQNMVVGCYGGNLSAGARKNEDGALVWCPSHGGWEFAMLLDAHSTAESAALLLRTIEIEEEAIQSFLDRPASVALPNLSRYLTSRFQSPAFRARCQFVDGETSCLICARKDRFLWWLSIGDCGLYLLHPELARWGQFGINQPSSFEWVGKTNTFDLPVACYSTGVKELRKGPNFILMVTDGLLNLRGGHYQEPRNLYKDFTFWDQDLQASVRMALMRVHTDGGIDSATVIAWRHVSPDPGSQPSKPDRKTR